MMRYTLLVARAIFFLHFVMHIPVKCQNVNVLSREKLLRLDYIV